MTTKKIITAALALVMALGLCSGTAGAEEFGDVSPTDCAYTAISYMRGHGYMGGYTPTVFGPNDPLSRAMSVTLLYRVSGEKVTDTTTQFADVPAGAYYTEAVAWAAANGIAGGATPTAFCPETTVYRCSVCGLEK